MNQVDDSSAPVSPDDDRAAVRALYESIVDGWNRRSGQAFAASLVDDGEVIGFDGSQHSGQSTIAGELDRIFADHPTGTYVAIVKSVRLLGSDAAVLRAVAGLVPAGRSDLEPGLNAWQTLVAVRRDSQWRTVLFQNTPAQFHGRPELAESLTEELRQALQAER
jgi:uncharacterized protein (TIGR02246 family)